MPHCPDLAVFLRLIKPWLAPSSRMTRHLGDQMSSTICAGASRTIRQTAPALGWLAACISSRQLDRGLRYQQSRSRACDLLQCSLVYLHPGLRVSFAGDSNIKLIHVSWSATGCGSAAICDLMVHFPIRRLGRHVLAVQQAGDSR